MKKLLIAFYATVLICFFSTASSLAHMVNQSYTYLRVYENHVTGRFEVAIKDLNKILGTDLDKQSSLDDIIPHLSTIQKYYLEHTGFSSDKGSHEIRFLEPGLLEVGGKLGHFLLLPFEFPSLDYVPEELGVEYSVLFMEDNTHAGALLIEYNWKAGIFNNESLPSLFFKQDHTSDVVNLHEGNMMRGFLAMIREGIWHIWIGLDHILFILALILPSVISRNYQGMQDRSVAWSTLIPNLIYHPTPDYYSPVAKFKPAFLYIIKIITFFTISHTITLALAAFQVITLPSRLIESIIAISIALAAIHNITPIFKGREWIIAFIFGLFHGFGFASVLSDLRTGDFLGLTLFGFNIGVEIGQVAIICVLFPILYLIRKTKFYNLLLVFGSFTLIAISLYWFIERAFDYDMQVGYTILQAIKSIFA